MRRRAIYVLWEDLCPFLLTLGFLLLALGAICATLPIGLIGSYDFRAFYASGYLIRTHPADLYNLAQQRWLQDHLIAPSRGLPFFSPAYQALLFTPFSWMSYRAAYLTFFVFNIGLVLVTFLVARPVFSQRMRLWQPRPGLMLLVFFPLLIALIQGQMSVVLLLVCCATWMGLERERVGLAGLILAAGVFKFNLIVPIAVILAVRWGWRFVRGFGGGAIAALGVSALLVGRHGVGMLVALLRDGSLATNQGAAAQAASTVFPAQMPTLYSLVYVVTRGMQVPRVAFGVTMVLSAIVVAVCAWLARREEREEVAFSVAVLCGLLVSYHLYLHDLTLLVLPLALLHRIPRHRELMLASYTLPIMLTCFAGLNSLFLLTPMLLWAVWLVARSQGFEGLPGTVPESAADV